MAKSKRSIRIQNPIEGGATHTTRRSAQRYVDRGRARYLGADCIEFVAAPVNSAAHSPRLAIIERNLASGKYRNDVLGLPNFVGIQPPNPSRGKRIAA